MDQLPFRTTHKRQNDSVFSGSLSSFPLLQLNDHRVIRSPSALPGQDDVDPLAGSRDLAFDAHAQIIRQKWVTQNITHVL